LKHRQLRHFFAMSSVAFTQLASRLALRCSIRYSSPLAARYSTITGMHDDRVRHCRFSQLHTSLALASSPSLSNPPCRGYAKKGKAKVKGKHDNTKPKVELVGDDLTSIIDVPECEHRMRATLEHLLIEFAEHLTLRTSVGALDSLKVQTADGNFPLIQLAQIVQKNPKLIVVDMSGLPQYITNVREAIASSGMNLNPQQDGTSIFVPIPPVTREYREQLAKNAKTLCDKTKVKLRNIHNQYHKELNKAKKETGFSTELIRSLEEHTHFLLKQASEKADEMMHQKQKEILGKD
jgi:ribosome recycling factor